MSRRRSKRRHDADEPVLFDLPLDPPSAPEPEREIEGPEDRPEPSARPERDPAPETSGAMPLFEEPELEPPVEPAERPRQAAVADPEPPLDVERGPPRPPRDAPRAAERPAVPSAVAAEPARIHREVTLASRYLAGLADLAVHGGIAVLLLLGARLLGVPAGFADWPALVVFLLAFSFLYSVLPLAFWGRTPGMAWAGLVARTRSGESLTFGQTALRWAGGLVTLALLGLPTLLAVAGGRSLTDRLSGSEISAA